MGGICSMESDLEATDMHANGLDGAAIHLTTRLRPFSCCPDATRCHTVAHKASSQKLSAIVVLCKFFERPHSVDAADLAWCTACARHEPKAAAIRGNHSSAQPACSALSWSRGAWPLVRYSACGARHTLRATRGGASDGRHGDSSIARATGPHRPRGGSD